MRDKSAGRRREVVTTCTRDCTNTCGLVATVEDGRVVRLRGDPNHPFTRGRACHKAAKFIKRAYSPERVLAPLRREKNGWKEIGWDDALDEIADKMKQIKRDWGPEAILYYLGYGERTALKLLNVRFFNLFGGVTTLKGSLCGGTGQASQDLDLGCRISHDPLDHYNSSSMILWGRNPVTTHFGLVPVIKDIRKRGGTVILVDPLATKSVRLCDHHIQVAPGRDAFLAMAAAKLILETGREDHTFLSDHCEGFDEYCRILDRFSLDELAEKCDVPKKQIHLLADTLLEQSPTAILLGWGLHRWEYAHYAIRSIDALGAISGTIGVSGGGVSQGFEEYGPYDSEGWGEHLATTGRKLLMPVIGEEILKAKDPPIKMIFVTGANPVCMAPNSRKVAEAFDRTEFVVVAGHFLDDTSDYAHIFLPVTTFLEETDVTASFGNNYVGPVNKAIAPLGQCKSDFEIFQLLAARFSFAQEYIRPLEDWLHELLSPLLAQGVTMEQIMRGAVRVNAPMVPYADCKFPTPSGKFRFMNIFKPEILLRNIDEYPYRLISVVAHDYIGSERTLSDHEPMMSVRVHPDEAAKKKLRDGQTVRVKSKVGELRARLTLDPAQRMDTVVCNRGGWIKAGHGVNLLTQDLASRVGNGTPYFETKVDLLPIDE
jgi:anaerobic selenocysteine-containing dehydrogenase